MFQLNFSTPSGAGRVTPAVNAFGKPGVFTGFGYEPLMTETPVAECVRRGFDGQLRDLDASLVRDASRLGSRLLPEIGRNVVPPERYEVRPAASRVRNDDELVGIRPESCERLGVVPDPREIDPAASASSSGIHS